jgi:hypothetical protein
LIENDPVVIIESITEKSGMTCFPRSAHEDQADSEEAGWGGGFKGLKVETDEDIGGIVGEPVGAGRRDDLASDVEKRVQELGEIGVGLVQDDDDPIALQTLVRQLEEREDVLPQVEILVGLSLRVEGPGVLLDVVNDETVPIAPNGGSVGAVDAYG